MNSSPCLGKVNFVVGTNWSLLGTGDSFVLLIFMLLGVLYATPTAFNLGSCHISSMETRGVKHVVQYAPGVASHESLFVLSSL